MTAALSILDPGSDRPDDRGRYFVTPSRCASRLASEAPELSAPSM
jgi:hypothetical protein